MSDKYTMNDLIIDVLKEATAPLKSNEIYDLATEENKEKQRQTVINTGKKPTDTPKNSLSATLTRLEHVDEDTRKIISSDDHEYLIKKIEDIKKQDDKKPATHWYMPDVLSDDDVNKFIEENKGNPTSSKIQIDKSVEVTDNHSVDKPTEMSDSAANQNKDAQIEPLPEDYSKNIILFGPPGTGKTYNTIVYAAAIAKKKKPEENKIDYKEIKKHYDELRYVPAKAPDNGEDDRGQIAFVTFHQSYGYEDFIEGIKPDVSKDGKISYKLEDGVFKRIAKTAHKNPNKNYVIIIDEINRGNISKIFGELITLIEESKREGNDDAITAILPYSKEPFSVPNNLYIIGTMNTADRSLTKLDTALRRRFTFIEMMPEYEYLNGIEVERKDTNENVNRVSIKALLKTMNDRIEFLRGRDYQIGHAWFMELKKDNSIEKLGEIFKNKIIPLLQEYFYDDYHKIQIILGDIENGQHNFITREDCPSNLFPAKDKDEAADCIYTINADVFNDIEAYLKICPEELQKNTKKENDTAKVDTTSE